MMNSPGNMGYLIFKLEAKDEESQIDYEPVR